MPLSPLSAQRGSLGSRGGSRRGRGRSRQYVSYTGTEIVDITKNTSGSIGLFPQGGSTFFTPTLATISPASEVINEGQDEPPNTDQ